MKLKSVNWLSINSHCSGMYPSPLVGKNFIEAMNNVKYIDRTGHYYTGHNNVHLTTDVVVSDET